jgi:hypothetical protein
MKELGEGGFSRPRYCYLLEGNSHCTSSYPWCADSIQFQSSTGARGQHANPGLACCISSYLLRRPHFFYQRQ